MSKDYSIMTFESPYLWLEWLRSHHADTDGLLLKLAKKASGLSSVTYTEALEVALCYGWIDGQKKAWDDKYWLQKFTPRRSRSIWSKVNCEKATELIAAGKMQTAGLLAIEQAKADGRWEAAYDSTRTATVPEDFETELAKNLTAKEFFEHLSATNRYAILWRLQTAKKPETRKARIDKFMKMLAEGRKLH